MNSEQQRKQLETTLAKETEVLAKKIKARNESMNACRKQERVVQKIRNAILETYRK